MLDNGRFWESYQLRTSSGDGHCFIYSMVTGFKSLHPSCNISSNDILGRLWEETINNSDMYIPFIENRSKESLCNGLKAYILHKVYNTSFGGLVPQIVVNALEINLIIIHKMEETYDLTILSPWHSDSLDDRCVMVFKNGLHYDGLCYVCHDKPKALCDMAYYRRITWPTSRYLQNYDMTIADSQYDKAEISDHLKYLDQINGDSVNKICSQNSVGKSACSTISGTSNPTIRSGLDYVSMTCRTDDESVDKKDNISILAWNINGLSQDKLNDAFLGLLLKRHDII